VHIALRDKNAALDWLEEAYRRRSYGLPEITQDSRFDPLRPEKRFRDLIARMGLQRQSLLLRTLWIEAPGTAICS
jgi:hypothetical protein